MEYYEDFLYSGDSFSERIGEPIEFDAAIGKVIGSFSFLESSMCNVITMFLQVEKSVGEIVTSELSFKGLLHLFSSLFKHKYERDDFKVSDEDVEARFKELMSLCSRAEQLRNQIIHSSYVLNQFRVKKTAKARNGLKTVVEKISEDEILDISDFIASAGVHVEELPMFLGLASSIKGGSMTIKYLLDNKIIAVFGDDVSA